MVKLSICQIVVCTNGDWAMSTRALFLISALFWIGVSWWNGEIIIAAVSIFCHFIAWQNHVIEVKLNKILDEKGIFVSMHEID
jgi:hypothetical protein